MGVRACTLLRQGFEGLRLFLQLDIPETQKKPGQKPELSSRLLNPLFIYTHRPGDY